MPVCCSIDQLSILILIQLVDLWRIITENVEADTSQYALYNGCFRLELMNCEDILTFYCKLLLGFQFGISLFRSPTETC